ncbi:T9SS type B sorting domain-containing protein [Flavobacterium psychrotrophum]|uniref:T9SS type B sorting domain-containing protein n=1 Tax=Flavobacterium psychrotrophum TaxID=2294119 RepID=UPI000E315D4C|nr:T9SS type B sorting domain-containing protein [Flavobacterium psychrotrophum]
MTQKYPKYFYSKFLLAVVCLVFTVSNLKAQIYRHEFGTTTINTYPYRVAPVTIESHLSGSTWTNNLVPGSWSSGNGSGGTASAIQAVTPTGAVTITLTFNVAPGFAVDVTSFNFWTRKSNSGPANWSMAINSITVGSGLTSGSGANAGATSLPVSNPVTGLTGTVSVVLTLTGGTGGNIRLDDFTLNGRVYSNCNTATVTSFTPATGPDNTVVIITGNGFTGAQAVLFGTTAATYTVISNTQIRAVVPQGAATGPISVRASDGCLSESPATFTVLTPQCASAEIYISELYDEYAGDPGVVEIYNPGANTVTFNGEYTLERFGDFDNLSTPGYNITLLGSVGPGQTHLVRAGGDAFDCLYARTLTYDTYMGGFNGKDAFRLRKNGVLIDHVTTAPIGNSEADRGYTMIRRPNAVAPNINFSASDWISSPTEYCSNLGMHTANPTPGNVPAITSPSNQSVCQGGTATFSTSVATGTGYTYQWKVLNSSGNWVNVTNGTNYAGATTATFTVSNIPASFDQNQYYCEITSTTCTLYSDAALLTTGATLTAPVVTPTDPTCTTLGSIVITAPTGAGLTYSIDGTNYVSTTTFTVGAGTYSITAKNAAGCISPVTTQLINPAAAAPVAPTVTPTQPTCTNAQGSIVITAPTGTGLTYSIDGTNYVATTTFSVGPGSYNVTVKNASGCISPATVQVINAAPSAPVAPTVTPTQPTCTNAQGSIVITAPTGTGLTYSIDGTNYVATTTFNVGIPGSYNVTVKNTAGCISPATVQVINAVPSAPAAPTVTPTQPTCTNAQGSIVITAPTGTGLTYSIDGTNYVATTTFNVGIPGSYNVTVKNAAGCISPATVQVINAAPPGPVAPTVTPTQPTCTNAQGSIVITAPTGAGLTYSLDGTNYVATTTFSVGPGSYSVTVKNAAGCISAATVQVINAVPSAPAAPTVTPTQPTCTNTQGSIVITAPTGAGLTYSIDGTNYVATTTFSVGTGSYNVTVKNAAGCISAATIQVINAAPTAPVAPTLIPTDPTCTTQGTIVITAPTGTGLTYSIDGINYVTATTFNVGSGTYNVTVKNAAGCISPATVQVINTAPAGPAAPLVTVTQPTCVVATGSLVITGPSGTGFTYSIDGINYSSAMSYGPLSAGRYTITVKNAAGCISPVKVEVINAQPVTPVAPTVMPTNPACGEATGKIVITAPLGAGYTYSIDGTNYLSTTTFNVVPGTYNITAKSAGGCISPVTVQIIDAAPTAPATPSIVTTQPDCTTLGTIVITAPVGAGITYSIDGIIYDATTTYSNLPPGNYTIRIKNAGGCISSITQRINAQPATPVAPRYTVTQPTCADPVGKITITSPYGAGYTYSLDDITYQTGITFTGLGAGTYTVYVKNAAGCKASAGPVVIDPAPAPAPSPGTITGNTTVCIDDTLQLTPSVAGGVWSVVSTANATIDANGLLTPKRAGTVTVVYTVGTVCTADVRTTITIYALPRPVIKDIYLCVDNVTGVPIPKVLQSNLNNTDYTFVWEKDGNALPHTTASILVMEEGEYLVTATHKISGCETTATGRVGLSSIALATAEVGVDFSRNQVIKINVTGGSGSYEYSLDGGAYQDDAYFTGIYDGEHTIRVNDVNGCGYIELTVFALNYPRFFSANSDGHRDTWNIKGLESQYNALIFIYDRYGKLITSIRPAGQGWDGTLNGYPLPATDYWFSVLYDSSTGTRKEFKAHFSLLR